MALIVISGKARTGKDTLGVILQTVMSENYYIMAYADELKRRAMADFGLSQEQVRGHLKEVEDERYPKPLCHDPATCSGVERTIYWTPREILQHMGTEAYRAVDSGFWIKQLFKYIHRNNLKNVIITDGRFPDEIIAVTGRKGYHIKMERAHDIKVNNTQHASETSLDTFSSADFVVNNNGTLEELRQKALAIKREIENGR